MLDLHTSLIKFVRNTILGCMLMFLLGNIPDFATETTMSQGLCDIELVADDKPLPSTEILDVKAKERVTVGRMYPKNLPAPKPDLVLPVKKAAPDEFYVTRNVSDNLYGFNVRLVAQTAEDKREFVDSLTVGIDPKVRRFILQNIVWVLQEAALKGILPSGKFAQGMLESGYGTNTLSKYANNYFGVKSKTGVGYKLKDDEYTCPQTGKKWHGKHNEKRCTNKDHEHVLEKSLFVIYPSAWKSWRGHSELLRSKDRYKEARLSVNYLDYCKYMGESGYATDIRYGSKLKNIIEKYKLYRLDNIVMNDPVLFTAFTLSQKR